MKWLGIQLPASHSDTLVSTLGGIISISLICLVSYLTLGLQGALAIVPSMGASAVLLFAVPHGPLSQPWALLGGHTVSAIIGVTVAQWVPNMIIAGGLAVGLAIGAMLLCRCTHPPGGATALAAVIGGDAIQQLGYSYLFVPVLLNCLVILSVALAFNGLFAWRRYPASAMRYKPISFSPDNHIPSQEYLAKALADHHSLLDISPSDLQQIYRRADELKAEDVLSHFDFELGAHYTNNRPGAAWSIRRIIDFHSHPDPTKGIVIYKVVEGANKNTTHSCSRSEFAEWAKQKLTPTR